MRHLRPVLLLCSLTSLAVSPTTARAAEPRGADVVVYGGTASGVIAAVAVAREGNSVLLLEPGQHLGGMVSGGLGATDTGNRGAIGGYSREFFNHIRDHYTKAGDADNLRACSDGFLFEPHVAESVFRQMLAEAKVQPLFGQRLTTVRKQGLRIESIQTSAGVLIAGTVFIDASYEGDLLAAAGVSYTVGREGVARYHESIAGVQKQSPAHQWSVKVPGLNEAGKPLPFIQLGGTGEPGAEDKKTQAYNFRLCMTQRQDNLVPFPKPDGYDPKRFELLARYLARKPGLRVGQLMNPVRVPNGKTDTNNNGPFSTDYIGGNWDYPDAVQERREQLWREHADYTKGFLYFLANDPQVPEALRKEMQSWGLAKDEFTDTGHWPHQLYVREARRMLGEYTMTQADIMDQRTKDDSVGLGSYNTDSHHVQRVLQADGSVLNEGDFQVGVTPYAIPYRSLVPKKSECTNLLVPVCLSASHVAYGTIRMEPVYMILGQASGVAAALAVKEMTAVQAVPIGQLRAKLKEQKGVVAPDDVPSRRAGAGSLDQKKLGGIVVDDSQATKTGAWVAGSSISPYVGDGYLHDNNAEKGKLRIRFTPKLPTTGSYQVRLYYSANPNRATNVPVVIHHAAGEKIVRINQRQAPTELHSVLLGLFEFAAGSTGWVEIRTDGTDGYVIADAVQFVPETAK